MCTLAVVLHGDAHRLSQFKDGAFGTIYSNVLDHFPYISRFAAAAHRVLRANGSMLIDIARVKADRWAFHDFEPEESRRAVTENITGAGFVLLSSGKSRMVTALTHYVFIRI